MNAHTRKQQLEALRNRIATMEGRPVLADKPAETDAESTDFAPAIPGLVQEVFVDAPRDAGLALGFALAQSRALVSPARPAVLYLQMAAQDHEFGLPYAPGLAQQGITPDQWILVRPATITELLWAAEEALACPAVAAVIANIAGQPDLLDFTASRRLSLRSAQNRTSIFLLRHGQWREASAAHLRWHVGPALSGPLAYDERTPGQPRWQVRLEKTTLTRRQNQQWLLEWSAHGLSSASTPRQPDRLSRAKTLSRPLPALLGDGLSQMA